MPRLMHTLGQMNRSLAGFIIHKLILGEGGGRGGVYTRMHLLLASNMGRTWPPGNAGPVSTARVGHPCRHLPAIM